MRLLALLAQAHLDCLLDLAQLPLATLQSFHPAIGDDVFGVLTLRGSMEARQTAGGTAPAQVRTQIERHRQRLAA